MGIGRSGEGRFPFLFCGEVFFVPLQSRYSRSQIPMANNPPETKPKAALSDYLAAERTLLAWIRTGLALMGFGFVVARFGLFLRQLQLVRLDNASTLGHAYGESLWIGTALIGAGILVNVLAGLHHLQLVRTLDRGTTQTAHSTVLGVAVALFLALVGLAMAIYLISIRS
jgi:putative membrane protein